MPRSCRFVDDPMESGFESAASPKIHVFSQIHDQQSFFWIGNWNRDPNPLNMVCHLVDGLKTLDSVLRTSSGKDLTATLTL